MQLKSALHRIHEMLEEPVSDNLEALDKSETLHMVNGRTSRWFCAEIASPAETDPWMFSTSRARTFICV